MSTAVGSQVSLVVQTSFLGDTVLTTPLLSALAARGPVDVIARPDAATLLLGHPAVRDVVVYDKRGADRGLGGIRRLVRAVHRRADGTPRGTTHAYLAQQSLRSALLPWLAGVPMRVGWQTSPARVLYTHRVAVPPATHFARRTWLLADPPPGSAARDVLGGTPPRPSLAPDLRDLADARALLGDVGGRPMIALAPGSIWGTKRWPAYPALAARLAADFQLVIVGGPDDRALADAIRLAAPDAIDATGRLSLLGSAALIGEVEAIVANDSVALHLASAMNTPTLALFGPTVPAFGFGPLAQDARVLEVLDLSCRPCHVHGPRVCPKGHFRCMRDLAVEDVETALRALIRSAGPRAQ